MGSAANLQPAARSHRPSLQLTLSRAYDAMPRRYTVEKSGLWCGKGRGLGSRHKTDQGRAFMFNGRKALSRGAVVVAIAAAVGSTLALAPARAQETVKIGLIPPLTARQ